MSIRQLPSARWTVPGTSGGIAANWYVYTYQPGTSTPKSTYTDYTGTVANSNPTVLDSRGEANIWWDGSYKVVVYTGDKDSGGVLVWSQDNYGEGTTSVLQGNFNLCLNGSFEQDTNGDNLPDNWACVAYSTGTVALDSTTQAHGAKSIKFTSVGAGGGYATSDKFEVAGSSVVPVSFYIISSAANVHNQVDIIWYTAAQAVISTTTLYNDSTTNPLTWTRESYNSTSPATARYAAIRIYGCKSDVARAGSAWFDGVQAEADTVVQRFVSANFPNISGPVTATESDLNTLAGAGLASNYSVFTTNGVWSKPTGLPYNALVRVELWAGGGGSGGVSGGALYPTAGGGGGAYACADFLASSVPDSVNVNVGLPGSAGAYNTAGGIGGTSSFGTLLYAYGGAASGKAGISYSGAGGGGISSAGSGATGGSAQGVAGVSAANAPTPWNGAGGPEGGTSSGVAGFSAQYGGGSGASSSTMPGTPASGGKSIYGGGGGASGGLAGSSAGGTSLFGGRGGDTGMDGVAPGGGAGGVNISDSNTPGRAGGRGECRVTVIR